MVDTSFQIPSLLALTLLSASTPQAGPFEGGERPISQALERGTRLDVLLVPGAEHRFRVRRAAPRPASVGAPVPDRSGECPEPAEPAARTLDLTLAVERTGRGRERVLTASLSREPGRAIVYYVLVDEHAAVERLRRHRAAGEPEVEAESVSVIAVEPTEAEVRRYVELALGAGLHGRRLAKGALFPLGAAVERSSSVREAVFAPKPEEGLPLDELALQFQGIGVGGAAQVARFGLFMPHAADGATAPSALQSAGGPALEGEVVPVGDASYSLADGLLSRLCFRPRLAPACTDAGAQPIDWLEIERVMD